ncbi:hypothetical protein F0562_010232 [Nyssa sinensis]|uniref:Apple domain-containing protein n=1 Tax=Nyssa sinensis TaxID=561372 RepID=A0A5J5A0I4_9ASTE|nr:hypothetical protein F0562_010232 [Nyssa sinensis]
MEFCNASDAITPNQSMIDGETLVSLDQRFELGFFSPGKSTNRYLGIWCKNVPGAILWVANRNKPITDSFGVLSISKNGTLFLHNQMRSVIWFSSASRISESPVVQLLDTGNLVITDKSSTSPESYIWQSFDFPTDTRLPGMKLGHGLNDNLDRYLVSWKSADDPSPGDFTYRIDNYGLPQLVIFMGSMKKFRSGPWNGLRFSGLPIFVSPFSPIFVFHEDKLYYGYDPYNRSVTTRLTLDPSGLLERYRLNETRMEWSLLYSVPRDQCDNFGLCGPNGICRIYRTPMCECLNGFIPKSQEEWEMLDWSSGCARRMPVGCQGEEGFLKVEGVKLPDFSNFWLNKSMNLKECKAECLKNCSCMAYANSDITGGGSGCLMWFRDLIDIREFDDQDSRQDIYIRLAASELKSIHDSNKKKRLVITVAVSVISGMLILGLLLWFIIWKKGSQRKGEEWELPLFDLATIATATNNFSTANVLGVGGFGPVYKVR